MEDVFQFNLASKSLPSLSYYQYRDVDLYNKVG